VRRAAIVCTVMGIATAAAGVGWAAAGELRPDPAPIVLDATPAPVAAVAAGDEASPRLIAEDGISAGDARRIERAAQRAVPGTVLSVERDDGLFHADVRERGGGISEVLLDDRFRVVGVDIDD
jgi:hypothetical protein